MTDTASIRPSSSGEPLRITYVPRPGLFAVSVVNFLLGLLTLTLYRFWAKTNTRRHIWSCVHINGEPLEYTGRGSELFKGALLVFAFFGLPTIAIVSYIAIAHGPEHPAIEGVQTLLFLMIAVLWGAAVYRARRYQLSRTLWRGIRGTLAGSSMTYSLTYFGAMLARAFTLGWITPVMNLNLQQQMIGDMRFGDQPFRFKGRAGPLYPAYALCWLLTLGLIVLLVVAFAGMMAGSGFQQAIGEFFQGQSDPDSQRNLNAAVILGAAFILFVVYAGIYPAVWSIYTARELRVFTGYTSFGDARFRFDATAGSLIRLVIGNLLLTILTLGIAAPYAQQRLIRYMCERITIEGLVDLDRIRQSMAPLSKTGEGLADAFDVGGI